MNESIEDGHSIRKKWTDLTTKWLIEELKIYYAAWRVGQIHNKKLMWLKIAKGLGDRGYKVTAEQASNRFKTLQRSYRKTYGIVPKKDTLTNDAEPKTDSDDDQGDESFYIDAIETFITDPNSKHPGNNTQDLKIIQIERKGTERPAEEFIPNKQLDRGQTEKVNIRKMEHQSIPEIKPIVNKTRRKICPPKRIKFRPSALNVISTTADNMLLDIKELIKKVEVRRQIRHEQSMKVAMERNRILKRKNEILAQIAYNFEQKIE